MKHDVFAVLSDEQLTGISGGAKSAYRQLCDLAAGTKDPLLQAFFRGAVNGTSTSGGERICVPGAS